MEKEVLIAFGIAAMLFALFALALEISGRILQRRTYRAAVKARLCCVCRKRGTMECPNSSECLATKDKPHWEEKGRNEQHTDD